MKTTDLFSYSSQKDDFKKDFDSLYSSNLPSYDKANNLFLENYVGSRVHNSFGDIKLYDAPNKQISESIDMSRRNFRRLGTKVPFLGYLAKKDYISDSIDIKPDYEQKYNTIKGLSNVINDKLDQGNSHSTIGLDLSDKLNNTSFNLDLKGEKKLVLDSIYLGSNTKVDYKTAKKEFDKGYLIEAFKSFGDDSTQFEKYVGRDFDSMKNKAKSLGVDFKYFTEIGVNERLLEESMNPNHNPFAKYFVDDRLAETQVKQNQELEMQKTTTHSSSTSSEMRDRDSSSTETNNFEFDESTNKFIQELHEQIKRDFIVAGNHKKKKATIKDKNDSFISKELDLIL
jgi:hypothetical protein